MAAWYTGDYVTSMLVFRGGKTFCASFCASCVCLSSSVRVLTETEWNTRGANVCSLWRLFVVVFSSLENYFGLRTTNVRVKTDHASVWGGIKRFEHFQRGLYFSDNCAFDLWINFSVQCFAIFRRTELQPACILLLAVTVSFFKCPYLFTFAEQALSLSYVKEP